MTNFQDGPAQKIILKLKRAPMYLRVVVSPAGTIDALDQIQDTPLEEEQVHAYVRIGAAGSYHVDSTDPRGRRVGAWYTVATYKLCVDQPGEHTLRHNDAWQAWCLAMDSARLRAEARA